MIKVQLDLTYVNNSIRTSNYELRFRYNTQKDYFYFDLFSSDGEIIRFHNKVITGYKFGNNDIYFLSNTYQSFANKDNISSFTAIIDG